MLSLTLLGLFLKPVSHLDLPMARLLGEELFLLELGVEVLPSLLLFVCYPPADRRRYTDSSPTWTHDRGTGASTRRSVSADLNSGWCRFSFLFLGGNRYKVRGFVLWLC